MMVLTKTLIKRSEENAVQSGAFSYEQLMLNAGTRAARIIDSRYTANGKKITVVCGSGNNGGDGFVAAAELKRLGADVSVMLPLGEPKTENARLYFSKLSDIPVVGSVDGGADIIIDAIFGIGLDRAVTGRPAQVIEEINSKNAVRISLDIPSGVFCDSGEVKGAAVDADMTVTFIALKPCFFLPDGLDYCGEVAVADIGVTPCGYDYRTIEAPVFKKRRRNSHKGTYGTALNICGSYGMAGAAILSARAALRSGVGILKAVIPESIYEAFTACAPECVCVPVKQGENGSPDSGDKNIYKALENADAVLVGCGLKDTEDTLEITKTVLKTATVPAVIDADGINAVSRSIDILRECNAPVIITPHPGEMSRLCGISVKEVESDRIGCAVSFAKKYGCTVVLKGANTVIASADGEVFFNTTGNAGMATGGSGDVLSGILGSLLAQGMEPLAAAKAAVYLHGLAGDKAAEKRSQHAMLPSDIIEQL